MTASREVGSARTCGGAGNRGAGAVDGRPARSVRHRWLLRRRGRPVSPGVRRVRHRSRRIRMSPEHGPIHVPDRVQPAPAMAGDGISGDPPSAPSTDRLELYWIPLGAGNSIGARVVRTSGGIYERLVALVQRRSPQPLFHAALVADTTAGRYVVEMTPVPRDGSAEERGVVATGAVGSRLLGRARIFRYEIRRWSNGVIPDIGFAIDSPVLISTEGDDVRQVLDLLPRVPPGVWGRDAAHAGEMWNSNSVVSWTLERAGLAERAGRPPQQGRAPGWGAGIALARRLRPPMGTSSSTGTDLAIRRGSSLPCPQVAGRSSPGSGSPSSPRSRRR
jgi:hypothetical protein